MKIVKLESSNVKRLIAVEIAPDPDGHLVVIGGANGAGKTSVLDSIEYALSGKRSLPKQPLRAGETHGETILETENLIITRTYTPTDSYIKVISKQNNMAVPSPQDLLNKLVGELSFDPLEFTKLKPVEQRKMLLTMLGIDFTAIDDEAKKLFDDRTILNREVKALDARVKAIPFHTDAPAAEVSALDLSHELNDARQYNMGYAYLQDTRHRAFEANEAAIQKVARLKAELKQAEDDLLRTQNNFDVANNAVQGFTPKDETTPEAQLKDVENMNAKFRENKARSDMELELSQKKNEADKKTARLTELVQQKMDLVAQAQLPVPALGVADDGLLLNGVPLEQASASEQLRLAVALGLKMNPTLRVILIRDGSLLDDTSLQLVAEMAEKYDAQVWMERVGEGQEVSVIIEDGMVKGAPVPAAVAKQLAAHNVQQTAAMQSAPVQIISEPPVEPPIPIEEDDDAEALPPVTVTQPAAAAPKPVVASAAQQPANADIVLDF